MLAERALRTKGKRPRHPKGQVPASRWERVSDPALAILMEAAEGLPAVVRRRMFGEEALFVGGTIFAIAMDRERILLRFPEERAFAQFLEEGAEPWHPSWSRNPVRHWLFAPEHLLDEPTRLREWVARAHAIALRAPPRDAEGPRKRKSR